MTSSSNETSQPKSPPGGARLLVAVFTGAVFLSACLLFAIQPLFTKMALPLLGGAPNVWNTAMVFFQGVLLAGYLYAHLLSRRFRLKTQLVLHVAVLAAGLIFLPIAIPDEAPPAGSPPALWLIGVFAVAIGAPFFALSANAPLLQRWFSHTTHPHAGDPYFLYAASNLGSLIVLCAYPLAIEPGLGLISQSIAWMAFYVLLAASVFAAGVLMLVNKDAGIPERERAAPHNHAAWPQRLTWVGIAALPSALMLGVTSHLSANVAAGPFLWVGPLALYLLTFVIAFSRKPVIGAPILDRLAPLAVLLGLMLTFWRPGSFALTVFANLLVFFIIAQFCHHHLAARRPGVHQLTEYYLAMSVGGVIGGAFTALAAPVIFNDVYEYPLLIVCAALVGAAGRPKGADIAPSLIAAAIGAAPLIAVAVFARLFDAPMEVESRAVAIVFIATGAFVLYRRNGAYAFAAGLFGLLIGGWIASVSYGEAGSQKVLFKDRNFFGVVKVAEQDSDMGPYHIFIHGDTVHNTQLMDDALRREPLLYYSRGGPFDSVISALRGRRVGALNVAAIGLGAGAVACYAAPGESWTFYEIDPAVVRIARDPKLFTYLSDCQPDARIITGDARVNLNSAADGVFDLIIVDAISSDSIPAHMVTREALALYRQKLKPEGLLLFHTTNRIVDVTSVVAALAEDAGLVSKGMFYRPAEGERLYDFKSTTVGVVIGTRSAVGHTFGDNPDWRTVSPHPFVSVWTDDYSHIVGAIAAHTGGPGGALH